jgi:orotate phosphoribosyltransferase
MTNLFQWGPVDLHSGRRANFKIDCDSLTDPDIQCIANIISDQLAFGAVVGIPTGGNRIAAALVPKITEGPTLLVDDVLTTGGSMWEAKAKLEEAGQTVVGRVIFARGPWPQWVQPVFWTSQWM